MENKLIPYLQKVQELEAHLYTCGKLKEAVWNARDEVSLEAQQVGQYQYGQPIPAEDDQIRKTVKSLKKHQQDMNRMFTTGNGRVYNSVLPSGGGTYKAPTEPPKEQRSYETDFFSHFGVVFIVLAAASLIGAIVTAIKLELFFKESVKCLLLYLAVSLALSLASYFVMRPIYRKRAKRQFDYLDGIYRKALEERNKALEPEVAYLQNCQHQINDLDRQADRIRQRLDVLYQQDRIHKKYRNFIAVSQILEYLECSRCTELTGPHGAYNLFEEEMRQNVIITQLQQINDHFAKLEQIQYILYQSVSSTMGYCNRLCRELESMKQMQFTQPKVLQELREKWNTL